MTILKYFKNLSINKILLTIIILLGIANLIFQYNFKNHLDKKLKIQAKNEKGEIIEISNEK